MRLWQWIIQHGVTRVCQAWIQRCHRSQRAQRIRDSGLPDILTVSSRDKIQVDHSWPKLTSISFQPGIAPRTRNPRWKETVLNVASKSLNGAPTARTATQNSRLALSQAGPSSSRNSGCVAPASIVLLRPRFPTESRAPCATCRSDKWLSWSLCALLDVNFYWFREKNSKKYSNMTYREDYTRSFATEKLVLNFFG